MATIDGISSVATEAAERGFNIFLGSWLWSEFSLFCPAILSLGSEGNLISYYLISFGVSLVPESS